MRFRRGPRYVLVLRAAFLVLFLAFLIYATFFAKWRPHNFAEIKESLLSWAEGARFAAIIFQAVGMVLLIPAFILILATAFIFGLDAIWISLLGEMLGSAIAYAISRYVGRDPLHALLGQRLIALEHLLERGSFRTLLLLRLVALIPGAFILYAPGLVNVSFRAVIGAALLGSIPFVVAVAYVGDSLGGVSEPAEVLSPGFLLTIIGSAAVVALPVVIYTSWRRRRKSGETARQKAP